MSTGGLQQGQMLAWMALAGVGSFVAAVAVLHPIQPDLSPVGDAVSYYMCGPFGWVLGAGLVLVGLGALALLATLRLPGVALSKAGLWLLGIWAWRSAESSRLARPATGISRPRYRA
jgi:hypothetical protein